MIFFLFRAKMEKLSIVLFMSSEVIPSIFAAMYRFCSTLQRICFARLNM